MGNNSNTKVVEELDGLAIIPDQQGEITQEPKDQAAARTARFVEAWNSEYRQELFCQFGVSKTAAYMMDTTERLWAAISQMLPDPLYAALQ